MNIGTLTDYRVDCKLYLQVGAFGSSKPRATRCIFVDTFATCDFNFHMRKYTQCGPRLKRWY